MAALTRGEPIEAAETLAEIAAIREAALGSDALDGKVGAPEEFAGAGKAQLDDIVNRGGAGGVLEVSIEGLGVHAGLAGKLFAGDGVSEIIFDKPQRLGEDKELVLRCAEGEIAGAA